MKYFWFNRTGRFITIFFVSLVICAIASVAFINNRCQLEYAQMEKVTMTRANKLNSVLTKLLYKSHTLAAFVQQSDGEIVNFEGLAATIVDDPSIRNVLLAPKGVVRYVYPQEGNESVAGLDYFSEGAGNKEAILAGNTKRLVLGGPFQLVQGGEALVGRMPVYVTRGSEKQFWGIASVTLNYPQALDGAELDDLQSQGFAYEIWRVNPDTHKRQTIAKSPWSSSEKANYVEYPMEILNAQWYFRLSPLRSWYQFPETWAFIFFGLLFSLLIGALGLYNFDLSVMKRELEQLSLYDVLTGVANRRSCFRLLHQLIELQASSFILCYLDLNQFKEINDCYGHNFGDTVLRYFVKVAGLCLNPHQHVLFRVGGDEFIIIFKDMSKCEQADAILEKISKALNGYEIPVQDGAQIQLTVSKGCAAFPGDGNTADELIAVADHKMYEDKRLFRP